VKDYSSLFRQHKDQAPETIFAHFYPFRREPDSPDFDEPFKAIARATIDGYDAWTFQQERFKKKHSYSEVPKLKNYLNYTFVRLVTLENEAPGEHFISSDNDEWISFNTSLQNSYGADLLAVFQRYKERPELGKTPQVRPDWVYKYTCPPTDGKYRNIFGNRVPKIAWYSKDSRDYVFDISYHLDRDAFDHLFERAKGRAGLPNASDEVIRNYLRGAIENLVPKIARNYKVAIPVYYVEEHRMQLLLPFISASDSNDVSCFLVQRDDVNKCYGIKTIFDLDQAYFSARLITRPDRDWLNP
jgi:hypothetical protein